MSKLDEAVEAAINAGAPSDTWVSEGLVFHDGSDGVTRGSVDGYIIDGEFDLKAAIQAAVKVLVPGQKEESVTLRISDMSEWETPSEYGQGYNNCRAETLNNAGIEE